jgi:NAD+ synthase
MNKIKNIKQNLMSFLKEEVLKTGLKKVTLGLSGGLDSAVVAVLCKEVFDDNLNHKQTNLYLMGIIIQFRLV